MSEDFTQQQSVGEQFEAERMSLQATVPPAEVPGYRLDKFIGAGAFGQVWSARDLNTGRRVAIKFYLHRSGVNWTLLSREVKNLVALSTDRYIVQVLAVGWEAEPPYYVMELIESGSLEDLLKQKKRLPVSRAVTLFTEIAEGLNHCHQKGVLHCDLKPANVLLDAELNPRLADFGQSRMTRDQTPALGTLFYMAPEQADLSAAPDARWDVYALGAIFYRMLTGNAPHRNSEALHQVDTDGSLPKRLTHYRQKITECGVPTEHRRISGVDKRLAKIIERCLHPVPDHRFQNVQQVIQALEARDQSLAKRPMMLLGIVGPLLLLATTCFFAWRMMEEASVQTADALRNAAVDQCRFAAKWVASGLESDLRGYFQTIETEAVDPELRDHLKEFLKNPPAALSQIPLGSAPVLNFALQKNLEQQSEWKQLSTLLHHRLSKYGPRKSFEETRPVLATIFVTDHRGTIVGIAYAEDPGQTKSSLAGNFFYRTYFHGGPEDLLKENTRSPPTPLNRTHLSTPFFSDATGLWKVAVSTPIKMDGNTSEIPDFIFVATINLGEFRLLDSAAEPAAGELAVLVDSRPKEFGLILQHPLMDRRMAAVGSFGRERYGIAAKDLQPLLTDGLSDYQDPMAAAPGGEPFAGGWVATAQRVTLPRSANSDMTVPSENSDLTVLVQYKLEHVLKPVGVMMETLVVLGLVTIGAILIVMIGLWYFVMRFHDQPTDLGDVSANSMRHFSG